MRCLSYCLVAALVLAAASSAAAQECVGKTVKVSLVNGSPAQPVDNATAFDLDGVEQHFESVLPFEDYRDNTQATFSCVDSRGEFNSLGTPGGDLAELAGAIVVYLNQTATKFSLKAVRDIFVAFMGEVPTKERPFYYHTSDEKLQKVFGAVANSSAVAHKPTVFPDTMPTDPVVKEAWLDALTHGSSQGCGHMRLMIDQFPDFGLPSADVPVALIRAFFEYWWDTPVHSEERQKSRMTIVQGPLSGDAVAIIDTDGGCPGKTPAVPPSHGGSQLFVYHAKAVDDFRKKVLSPFFVDYARGDKKTLDETAFYNALKSLQAKQLSAVLTYLAPANALPLWAVTVQTEKGQGGNAPVNTRPRPQNLANPAYAPKAPAAKAAAATKAAPKPAPPAKSG